MKKIPITNDFSDGVLVLILVTPLFTSAFLEEKSKRNLITVMALCGYYDYPFQQTN
jgi:hypothetical protein